MVVKIVSVFKLISQFFPLTFGDNSDWKSKSSLLVFLFCSNTFYLLFYKFYLVQYFPFLLKNSLVAHHGPVVFMTNSHLKNKFPLYICFNLKLYSESSLKLVLNSVSFGNQFQFYFILVFNFRHTFKDILFYFYFLF